MQNLQFRNVSMSEQVNCLIDKLSTIPEVKKVYFQPPASVKLKYPCIIIQFSGYNTHHADNGEYFDWLRYDVKVIDLDPLSDIPQYLKNMKDDFFLSFDRWYVYENINHWSFTLTMTKKTDDIFKEE